MIRTLHLLALVLLSVPLLALDVFLSVQHAACGTSIGSITAATQGGVWPYTYSWSNGATTSWLTDVPVGTYTLTVTDSEGSTASATAEIISTTALFLPPEPVTLYACDGPCSATLWTYPGAMGGVQPMTVEFDPPGPTGTASPNGLQFISMCSGNTYNVTVTDANGCSAVYGPISVTDPPEALVTALSVTPSCPDGSTGSLTIAYDLMDSVFVSGPQQTWFYLDQSPGTLTNLPPGEYVVSGHISQPDLPVGVYVGYCYTSYTLVVPETSEPCGTIQGTVYADVDDDCAQGVADPGLPHRVLNAEPGGHLVMTDADGNYATELFYGNYTLDATLTNYSSDCVTLPAPFSLDAINTTATIDLPMHNLSGPDLRVFVAIGGAVPGFENNHQVVVTNDGPFSFTNIIVDLDFDPLLSYVSSAPAADLVEPGHLQWTIAAMGAFSAVNLHPVFLVPANAGLIGTSISATTTITLDAPDVDPTNDVSVAQRTITGAFDPNDKLAETSSRSSATTYYLDEDTYVDYTIRFQNTGTGPAYNVYLLDTISPLLDLTSFDIIAASHAYTASLDDPRVLRFDFTNIMLPDSGSNMAGSQGFIRFRLKPVDDLAVGQQLVNAADIFFDFNEPIRTNDAVLNVEESTGIATSAIDGLRTYPNPVSDVLWLEVPEGATQVWVIAADGRTVTSQRVNQRLVSLDLAQLRTAVYAVRCIMADGSVLNTQVVKR